MGNEIPKMEIGKVIDGMAVSMSDLFKQYGHLNQSDSGNIFYSLNASNYEIRQASFFSWLFDSSRYSHADHFIASFISALGQHIYIGPKMLEGMNSYIEEGRAEGFLEVNPIKKGVGYTELVMEDKQRIDFAADIEFKDGRRNARMRLVIEFKNRGHVTNDLDAYKKFARKGKKRNADFVCILLDIAGKHHGINHDFFGEVPGSVLIRALRTHLALLGSRKVKADARDRYYIKDYLSMLERADGKILSPYEPRMRKILWGLWNPVMQHPDIAQRVEAEYWRLLKCHGDGPLVDAASGYDWSWLMVDAINRWFLKGLRVKPYGGHALRLRPSKLDNPNFYAIIFGYGINGLKKKYRGRLFLRVMLLNYQARSEQTDIERKNWYALRSIFQELVKVNQWDEAIFDEMGGLNYLSGQYHLVLDGDLKLIQHSTPSTRSWSMGIHINIPVTYKELEKVCVGLPSEPPSGGAFEKVVGMSEIIHAKARWLR